MHRPLSALACACTLAACTASQSPSTASAPAARPQPAPAATKTDGEQPNRRDTTTTRLSIYSGDYAQVAQWQGAADGVPGYALVDTRLHASLEAGDNTLAQSGLPRAIDVGAVALRPQTTGVSIVGQRYLSPPAGAGALLAASLGQRVSVEHTSGNAKQTDSGILVAAGDGVVLALPDGRTEAIRDYDNLSLLDSARQPSAAPSLRWSLHADQAGDASFDLSYPTGGLAWRAEYRATLARGDDCRLALQGAALVANHSGVDFDDVALTLVAGEPNRVQEDARPRARMESFGAVAAAPPPPMPEPRRSGEYYAYPIPARATLADASIERVPLFAPQAAVACTRSYETAPAVGVWSPPRPLIAPGNNGSTGPQPVKATVAFDNDQASGLGRPLPAGRVRVFDGGDFLGEARLGHTPVGASLRLDVGTSFDLTAERTRKSFDVDRRGRMLTEAFTITLRNGGDKAAKVTVVEPLPRWSNWKITDASVPASKRDAQHAEFAVDVPAKGETVLAYTVLYRWPEDVRP